MSTRRQTRARHVPLTVVMGAGVALLIVLVVVSLVVGARVLSPVETFGGLVGDDTVAAAVIWELRLPRTLLGLLVGAALGVAGALAQSVTRNPLADPGLLGISAGAAVAVVVGGAFLGLGGGTPRVMLAIVGAALATVAVFLFARRSPDGLTPVNLTLAGMALTAFLGALVSATVLLSASTMDQYRFWVVGALTIPDPGTLLPAALIAAVGGVVAASVSGALNTLAVGDDAATALGVNVARTRIVAGTAVVLLSGTAVALSGPIAFVGLIIPHLARALVGHDVRRVLVLSAVLGPLLLLAADVAGRLVVRPSELQAGVVTAILGAPFLIWLTWRSRWARGAR